MRLVPLLPRHHPGWSWQAHRWPAVVEFYRQAAPREPRLAAMAALVEHIAASPLALALHPSTSHYLLRLFNSASYNPWDDQIQIEHDGEAFEVRYHGSPRVHPHSVTQITSHWSKRGADGVTLLRRCLHHLAWVVEEHPTNA